MQRPRPNQQLSPKKARRATIAFQQQSSFKKGESKMGKSSVGGDYQQYIMQPKILSSASTGESP